MSFTAGEVFHERKSGTFVFCVAQQRSGQLANGRQLRVGDRRLRRQTNEQRNRRTVL